MAKIAYYDGSNNEVGYDEGRQSVCDKKFFNSGHQVKVFSRPDLLLESLRKGEFDAVVTTIPGCADRPSGMIIHDAIEKDGISVQQFVVKKADYPLPYGVAGWVEGEYRSDGKPIVVRSREFLPEIIDKLIIPTLKIATPRHVEPIKFGQPYYKRGTPLNGSELRFARALAAPIGEVLSTFNKHSPFGTAPQIVVDQGRKTDDGKILIPIMNGPSSLGKAAVSFTKSIRAFGLAETLERAFDAKRFKDNRFIFIDAYGIGQSADKDVDISTVGVVGTDKEVSGGIALLAAQKVSLDTVRGALCNAKDQYENAEPEVVSFRPGAKLRKPSTYFGMPQMGA